MQYDTPLIRRIVAITAAVLFFVGVFGAFAVDDSDTEDDLAGDGDTSLLMTEDTAGGEGDGAVPGAGAPAAGSPSTTAPAGGSGKGPAATAATAPAPSAPACSYAPTGAVKPPAAGTYRYDRKITEGGETEEKQADVKFEPACTEGGVTRQKMVVKEEQGTFVNTLGWSADAVRLELTHLESSFGAYDCDWAPDSLEIALPLAVGKAWTLDSSCTANVEFRGQSMAITIRRTGEFKVTAQKRDDVGGSSVTVWVVEGKSVIETSGGFNQRQEVESIAHLAPDHGLRVYTKEVTKGTVGDVTVEQKLTSLKPR